MPLGYIALVGLIRQPRAIVDCQAIVTGSRHFGSSSSSPSIPSGNLPSAWSTPPAGHRLQHCRTLLSPPGNDVAVIRARESRGQLLEDEVLAATGHDQSKQVRMACCRTGSRRAARGINDADGGLRDGINAAQYTMSRRDDGLQSMAWLPNQANQVRQYIQGQISCFLRLLVRKRSKKSLKQ